MSRPVVHVSPGDTLEHVARVMQEANACCVAVVSADGRCQGVLREREFTAMDRPLPFSATDSAPALFGEWLNPRQIEQGYAAMRFRKVVEVMVAGSRTTEDARLTQVLPLLQRGDVILVVRDERPVGTLCRRDLLKLVAPPGADGSGTPEGRA